MGTGKRPPIYTNEQYEYYHHDYDEAVDYSKQNKKWKKVQGGALMLEPRVKLIYIDKI